MKQKIYTLLLAITVVATAQFSHAQSPYTLNQVIVLNQGYYSGKTNTQVSPVTVGSYAPSTKSYTNFDTISNAQFASYVVIDSGYIYVAADSLLIKYDLNTKKKVAQQTVQGIREIAIWGNQLLVTCGQSYALSSYFQAYDKNTLNLVYKLTSVSAATEGIKVLNDTAYIAINDFASTEIGKLGVIDLNGQVENREINLGATAYNPFDVEVETNPNMIYTVNDLNFDSTSITQYNPSTDALTTVVVNKASSCSGSTFYLGSIFFQTYGDNNIDLFRTSQLAIWDSLSINKPLVGLAPDSVNGVMYFGNNIDSVTAKVFVCNLYGGLIDSFNTGVYPSNFAFDVRSTAGINQVSSFAANLVIYPNPVADNLHMALIDSKDAQANLTLTDIIGRRVYEQQIPTNAPTVIPINSLIPGMYFLKVQTSNGELTKKIVKE
jgi:hypothetical protein